MLRAAALTLLILVSVVVTLPLVDSSARESGRSVATRRHNRVGRRYSRAWWRRYRARMRRKRAALRRKRALEAMRRGGNLNSVTGSNAPAAASHKGTLPPAKLSERNGELNKSRSAWNMAMPNGWSRRAGAAPGEMRFIVSAQDGRPAGEAALSVVSLRPSLEVVMSARMQRKSLAGVPLTELRRTVIDRMIQSNGWVVNDMQRDIGGRNVYIVLAQTAMSNDGRTPQLSWVFYFTEVDGRIYSLATRSLLEFADRIASEAAQLVSSFHANSIAPVAVVSGKNTK